MSDSLARFFAELLLGFITQDIGYWDDVELHGRSLKRAMVPEREGGLMDHCLNFWQSF